MSVRWIMGMCKYLEHLGEDNNETRNCNTERRGKIKVAG